jgi:predicted dehydrogenase
MLKVAIVGCGKIADAHASQIQRIAGCEIVGVCDTEPLMASQLFERFPVGAHFSDVNALIANARPDVVHITTPPESHFDLARWCLERGCHVYVEKPFTLRVADAEALTALATHKKLKLTVGHDDQFSHVTRRLRGLVERGYLGGRPIHMESSYCYDLGDGYARALLGDRHHWIRRLPGKLLHNVISHGVARIAEFLRGDRPHVIAHGFVSPRLAAMGEREIVDELRVIIQDEESTTASFTFSSRLRPTLHQFRIYGPKGGLVLDQDQETLIEVRGARYKSYGEKFIPPLTLAAQHLGNAFRNVSAFLARDFHMKSGMKYLIESFYRSIADGGPVPIPYREIVLTARIMEEIFDQIGAGQSDAASMPRYAHSR